MMISSMERVSIFSYINGCFLRVKYGFHVGKYTIHGCFLGMVEWFDLRLDWLRKEFCFSNIMLFWYSCFGLGGVMSWLV